MCSHFRKYMNPNRPIAESRNGVDFGCPKCTEMGPIADSQGVERVDGMVVQLTKHMNPKTLDRRI